MNNPIIGTVRALCENAPKVPDCFPNLLVWPWGRRSPGLGWFAGWSRESRFTIWAVCACSPPPPPEAGVGAQARAGTQGEHRARAEASAETAAGARALKPGPRTGHGQSRGSGKGHRRGQSYSRCRGQSQGVGGVVLLMLQQRLLLSEGMQGLGGLRVGGGIPKGAARWLGALRESGHLGRIPNCSEAPPPPAATLMPPRPPPSPHF